MSGDLGARVQGTGDDDDTAMQEQQHAGWRSTYLEHVIHGRHRARVPATDVHVKLFLLMEQLRHAGDTRRARSRELRAAVLGQALQRGGIHLGVRDAVDVERVADRDTGAHDGHAVRREIVRLR